MHFCHSFAKKEKKINRLCNKIIVTPKSDLNICQQVIMFCEPLASSIFFGCARFGLVFCDPVLASLTVCPVLLLNKLPGIIDAHKCFECQTAYNETYQCVFNTSALRQLEEFSEKENGDESDRQKLFSLTVCTFAYCFFFFCFCFVFLVFFFGGGEGEWLVDSCKIF